MATIADINQECRDLCDANTTSYTAATLLRRVNQAYEETILLIQGCDGLWQFDDTNYTNFPRATANLVAGQQDYTFASDILEVETVSVKDSNGNYQLLTPIDISQMGVDPSQYQKTNGMPIEYDKMGNSILLYPAAAAGDVTLAAGLKVTYKRTAQIYTSAEVTTGTKQPGFISNCHMILAYKAALPYCAIYKKDIVPFLLKGIDNFEKKLKEHYGRRELDRRKVMTMGNISFQ